MLYGGRKTKLENSSTNSNRMLKIEHYGLILCIKLKKKLKEKLFGRHKCRWGDNVDINMKDI
jgi:hypothetical protein